MCVIVGTTSKVKKYLNMCMHISYIIDQVEIVIMQKSSQLKFKRKELQICGINAILIRRANNYDILLLLLK